MDSKRLFAQTPIPPSLVDILKALGGRGNPMIFAREIGPLRQFPCHGSSGEQRIKGWE